MERVVTGVTLQTLPQAVRRAGLKPGQRFTITVEGETVATSKAAALQRLTEISRQVSGRMAADGIVTEDDKQAFIDGLYSDDGK